MCLDGPSRMMLSNVETLTQNGPADLRQARLHLSLDQIIFPSWKQRLQPTWDITEAMGAKNVPYVPLAYPTDELLCK